MRNSYAWLVAPALSSADVDHFHLCGKFYWTHFSKSCGCWGMAGEALEHKLHEVRALSSMFTS